MGKKILHKLNVSLAKYFSKLKLFCQTSPLSWIWIGGTLPFLNSRLIFLLLLSVRIFLSPKQIFQWFHHFLRIWSTLYISLLPSLLLHLFHRPRLEYDCREITPKGEGRKTYFRISMSPKKSLRTGISILLQLNHLGRDSPPHTPFQKVVLQDLRYYRNAFT